MKQQISKNIIISKANKKDAASIVNALKIGKTKYNQ